MPQFVPTVPAVDVFPTGAEPNPGEAATWGTEVETAVNDALGLFGSVTYNPPSLVDGEGVTTTVTVTGAALGDFAIPSFSLDLQGILLTAYVSAADTVSCRFQNETTGTINLASGTLRAWVRVAP